MAVIYTGEKILAENVDFDTFLRGFGDGKIEFDDGKVIELPPSSPRHNLILRFLANLLEAYLRLTGEGQVFSDSIVMRFVYEGKTKGPIADVLVLKKENMARLQGSQIAGAADLVIEVMSPESEHRDRVEKFKMYEAVGIQEYWIIDGEFNEAFFYVLDEHQLYVRQKLDEKGVYHSSVLPRFHFAVSNLFQEPVPGLFEAVELGKKMIEER